MTGPFGGKGGVGVAMAVACGLVALAPAAGEGGLAGNGTEAALIAEQRGIVPGGLLTVALRLKPKEGWHTYWRNPGDSGMATVIDWHLPAGFVAGPVQWPAPERFDHGPITSYGYGGEALLLTEITAPPELAGGEPVALAATAHWLVCRDICVPESADLALSVPVVKDLPAADAAGKAFFSRARAALPEARPWATRYRIDGERLRLVIETGEPLPAPVQAVAFFPYDGILITHGAPQRAHADAGRITLDLQRAGNMAAVPEMIEGVLKLTTAARTHAVEIKATREAERQGDKG